MVCWALDFGWASVKNGESGASRGQIDNDRASSIDSPLIPWQRTPARCRIVHRSPILPPKKRATTADRLLPSDRD